MNSDEIKSVITRALILVFSSLATKYGVDGNTLGTVAGAVVTLAAFAYGIYENRGQKKVPVAATALLLPDPSPPKGAIVDLTPMQGIAKVA